MTLTKQPLICSNQALLSVTSHNLLIVDLKALIYVEEELPFTVVRVVVKFVSEMSLNDFINRSDANLYGNEVVDITSNFLCVKSILKATARIETSFL